MTQTVSADDVTAEIPTLAGLAQSDGDTDYNFFGTPRIEGSSLATLAEEEEATRSSSGLDLAEAPGPFLFLPFLPSGTYKGS